MAYLQIQDHIFDRTLTLRDSYTLMERFISEYNAQGKTSRLALLAVFSLCTDGTSSDPALIYDFVRIAGAVLDDERLRDAAGPG